MVYLRKKEGEHKMRSLPIFILFILLLAGCSSEKSWAYEFVKYNDVSYTLTEENLESGDISGEIGEVKEYLKSEKNPPNFSSNVYKKGTKLFKISKVDSSEAIAVKLKGGTFMKLEANKE